MKTLVTLGLLTLGCFLLPRLAAGSVATELLNKDNCCIRISPMKIPKTLVLHAEMTPESCKPRAMIITTKKNKTICIDPETKFAKKNLSVFLKPSNSSTS